MDPIRSISLSRKEPAARIDHSMGIVKRKIFVYAGIDSFDTYMNNDVWEYDIHRKNWSKNEGDYAMPNRCYFSEIVTVDNGLYVIVFEDCYIGNEDRHVISYFNINTNKWSLLTSLHDIHPNYKHRPSFVSSMFHYDNALYILAEIPLNTTTYTIFKYSLLTKSWLLIEQNGQELKIMNHISGSVFENKYYCFGDSKIFPASIYKEVHIFDLKIHKWSHMKTCPDFDTYPTGRINSSISFNKTHGFLSGGLTQSGKILDDLWSIELATLEWHKFNFALESKIMSHTSAIYDNSTLFIFGGMINGDTKVNKLQKYVIEPPSLYKFCLYVLMRKNNEYSELENLPIAIRQDIITRQEDSHTSELKNILGKKNTERKRCLEEPIYKYNGKINSLINYDT